MAHVSPESEQPSAALEQATELPKASSEPGPVIDEPTQPGNENQPSPQPSTANHTTSDTTEKKAWVRPSYTDESGRFWVEDSWDLNLDLALGPIFEDEVPDTVFMGRLRSGVLWIREPHFWSLGPTIEISTMDPIAFGLQGELMHFYTGLWAQLTAFVDIRPRAGFAISAGWSIWGVEAQLRHDPATKDIWSLLFKLRVPIRMLTFVGRR
jgi:hypothetical protein